MDDRSPAFSCSVAAIVLENGCAAIFLENGCDPLHHLHHVVNILLGPLRARAMVRVDHVVGMDDMVGMNDMVGMDEMIRMCWCSNLHCPNRYTASIVHLSQQFFFNKNIL